MTIPLFSDDDLAFSAGDLAASLPDVSTPMSLPGLEGSVTICRDAHGIPHVRAGTTHDALLRTGVRDGAGQALAHGARPSDGPRSLG